MPGEQTQYDAVLTENICNILQETNLPYHNYQWDNTHQNLCFSDNQNILIKVTRPETSLQKPQQELDGTIWASQKKITKHKPTVSHILQTSDKYGRTRNFTVWPWLDPVTKPSLRDQAHYAAHTVIKISKTRSDYKHYVWDHETYHQEIRQNLYQNTFNQNQNLLKLSEKIAQKIENYEYINLSYLHGDLHLNNIQWTLSGKPVVIDWENFMYGPIEIDIAQIFRSINNHFTEHSVKEKNSVWETTQSIIKQNLEIDWYLVDLLILFRSIGSVSYLTKYYTNSKIYEPDLQLIQKTSTKLHINI